MKKAFLLILSLICCTILICSCGAATESYAPEMPAEDAMNMETDSEEYYEEEVAVEESETSPGLGGLGGNIITNSDRKLVYTASYDIQTEEYEQDYISIINAASRYNGYVSNESTYGTKPVQQGDPGRMTEIELKIPVENYTKFTADLSGIGYITNKNQFVDDITTAYMDTESRINLLETRYDKLNQHLKQATKMEDIITLEDEMTQILYELEVLKGEMRGYDNLITYSTINIRLDEVVEITEMPVSKDSFWDRAGDGFMSTMAGVGAFFEGVGVFLVSAFPVLVILAILAAAVIVIIKASKKGRAKKAEEAKAIAESKLVRAAKIEKTADGILNVYPTDRDYPSIYRSTMAVYWNDDEKFLYHLDGQNWTIEQWYTQILKAVGIEYDNRLLITPDTEWINISDEERRRILGAEQFVYSKK